jgi:chemotaxis protein methyltransferase CheR
MGVALSINDLRNVTDEMARYDRLDYSGFTHSFLKRRLGHVFDELRVKKISQFVSNLADESFREKVRYHLAVNVTEMFRDPGFWRSLRQNVFPLFKESEWSVWFPDIQSGEEVFSLVILLKEDGIIENVDVVCQRIFDVNNIELDRSNYKRLEESDRFDEFFTQENGSWVLHSALLSRCTFRPLPITNKKDEPEFDLIVFRNSTINYTFQYREEVLRKVVGRLKPGGVIALGVKELMPVSMRDGLITMDEKESIYKKPG